MQILVRNVALDEYCAEAAKAKTGKNDFLQNSTYVYLPSTQIFIDSSVRSYYKQIFLTSFFNLQAVPLHSNGLPVHINSRARRLKSHSFDYYMLHVNIQS